MKLSGLVALASFCLSPVASRSADATSPVDYTQRNAPFAPGPGIAPAKATLVIDRAVQERRVETPTVDKVTSALGERRAPIDLAETRAKVIREKDSHRPERIEPATSAFNRQLAAISTDADTHKPALVSRYQDSLTAASASNLARFPALNGATTAKLNRFVFRKNAPEPLIATDGAAVTPAGGAPLRK